MWLQSLAIDRHATRLRGRIAAGLDVQACWGNGCEPARDTSVIRSEGTEDRGPCSDRRCFWRCRRVGAPPVRRRTPPAAALLCRSRILAVANTPECRERAFAGV